MDTGHFLGDERSVHGELRGDMAVLNEWAFKAYDRFTVDVANLSAHELTYVSRFLAKGEFERQAADYPVLKRLVSANIVSTSASITAPRPFVIREIADRKAGGAAKPIRVAFVGLSEMKPEAPKGLKITDPMAAAARAVPQARRQADLVIVLAHLKTDEALRVAREVPGIDALIAGNGEMFTPPQRAGQTLVAFTPYETRFLGEVRFYRDAQGRFSTRERYISLDEKVGDDQEAKQMATTSENEGQEDRKAGRKRLYDWIEKTQRVERGAAGADAGPYAGSLACAQCHALEYSQWSNSGHAKASSKLVSKELEFEAGCLSCHGSGTPLEKTANALPPLQNVQCEHCHGPGKEHVAKPAKGFGRVTNMAMLCTSCHTQRTSPDFNLPAAWSKIKH